MTTTNGRAIDARQLTKRYDAAPEPVLAVDDLDLQIGEGSIYALLGPNGAGKTTTISMLTTLIEPTEGTATVAGFDIREEPDRVRERIGVTFQDIVLDPDLTGRQVLHVHGKLYRQSADVREARIAELVGLVELEDAVDRQVKTYSGGMKRRLELARGLMTDPDVLFLDEPTQGLDPQNRVAIWDYLRALQARRGMTVLLTTHYMEEAEALADRVGIIDLGRLVVEGTPAELVDDLGSDVIRINGSGDVEVFVHELQGLPFVQRVARADGTLQIGVDHGNRRLADVIGLAARDGVAVEEVSITKPSLDDVFLKHSGRQLRDR